jgi:hypothetical protein
MNNCFRVLPLVSEKDQFERAAEKNEEWAARVDSINAFLQERNHSEACQEDVPCCLTDWDSFEF